MSDAAWASLASIVVTLASLVAMWLKLQETNSRVEKVAEVTTDTAETVETVHTLTNSGMTEIRSELKAARDEIRRLQQMRVEQAMNTAPQKIAPAETVGQPNDPTAGGTNVVAVVKAEKRE